MVTLPLLRFIASHVAMHRSAHHASNLLLVGWDCFAHADLCIASGSTSFKGHVKQLVGTAFLLVFFFALSNLKQLLVLLRESFT